MPICKRCGTNALFLPEGGLCRSCTDANTVEKPPPTELKRPRGQKVGVSPREKTKRRYALLREVVAGIEGPFVSGVQRELEERGVYVSYSTVKRDLRKLGLNAENVRR